MMGVRVSEALWQKLVEAAKRAGKTASAFVRDLVRDKVGSEREKK